MTLPSSFRTARSVGEGSLVELSLKNGKTVITPKVVIDRSKFPTADDEYTPAQRRMIDAQLAEGLEDIRKGRVSPRFNTVDEMLVSLKAGPKTRSRQKKTRSR